MLSFLQKGLQLGGLRIAEDLLGCAFLCDVSVGHKDDAVCHGTGKFHLVGDHHHGVISRLEPANDRQHLTRQLGVKSRGRLVKAQTSGVIAKALAIATRCC